MEYVINIEQVQKEIKGLSISNPMTNYDLINAYKNSLNNF